MNKKIENSKKILEFIRNNNWLSSTQIGKYFNMTKMSAFSYLSELLDNQMIYKSWKGKNTRYFYQDKKVDFIEWDLINKTISILENEYDLTLKNDEIISILEKNFCYINPQNGQLTYSLNAFLNWCKDPKRAFKDEIIPSQLALYLVNFLDIEALRRKSGFFDGTESMRKILSSYIDVYLDKIFFCNISEISWFGRTRVATELYYWKQNSDRFLLESAIKSSITTIKNYISKNNIDTVIFTPPTIARIVQFKDVLKNLLNLNKNKIIVSKIKTPEKILIAQKFTKWADRIANAETSINIENIKNLSSISHILILDDNFTTWATINAISKKLRFLGFTGKISAITITGKFHYDAIINMDEI